MPALQRLQVRWQVVWGTPPERVTSATVWVDLPLADYSVDLGASFSSSDAFPRARPASGRITIISRDGRYSPSATSRPSGAPDAELLKRRSAVRWQWQDPGSAVWQTRWTGSLTDLEDSGDDQVSARLESAQTQELAARTTIEEGDTTGATLLVEFGVVSAVTPPQDTLLTMPDLRRRRLTIISDLAEVMASWPIELHTSQLCILAPADVTIARMNAAPVLDLSARITGAYQVEACDTMRTSRIRYAFGSPSGGQNFDTVMETVSVDLSPGESLDGDVEAPAANQNYLWKIAYDSGDFTSPEARIANTILAEDATPVPGYGSPPTDVDPTTNPDLRTVSAFLNLIGFITPSTAAAYVFDDALITVTVAIPTLDVMTDDLRVTIVPRGDSRGARVIIRNVATESGRTWLQWSGAWRDVTTRYEEYWVDPVWVFADASVAALTLFRNQWMTLFPTAIELLGSGLNARFVGNVRQFQVWGRLLHEVTARTEPWVVDRVAPPTYRYRGSLDILANRQADPGRGGNYIYATNDTLVTDDATASPQEWWRTDDTVSAQRLADTLAVPRTFLQCTILDWPAAGESNAHTIGTCDIIRITFFDPTRNLSVEAPFAVIGMQHNGEVGSPGQTTLRLLSLTRQPAAPTGITVNRLNNQRVRATWTEEDTIYGSAALGTDVEYRLTHETDWTAIEVAAGIDTERLEAPAADGTWEVRLRTLSTAGTGGLVRARLRVALESFHKRCCILAPQHLVSLSRERGTANANLDHIPMPALR